MRLLCLAVLFLAISGSVAQACPRGGAQTLFAADEAGSPPGTVRVSGVLISTGPTVAEYRRRHEGAPGFIGFLRTGPFWRHQMTSLYARRTSCHHDVFNDAGVAERHGDRLSVVGRRPRLVDGQPARLELAARDIRTGAWSLPWVMRDLPLGNRAIPR